VSPFAPAGSTNKITIMSIFKLTHLINYITMILIITITIMTVTVTTMSEVTGDLVGGGVRFEHVHSLVLKIVLR